MATSGIEELIESDAVTGANPELIEVREDGVIPEKVERLTPEEVNIKFYEIVAQLKQAGDLLPQESVEVMSRASYRKPAGRMDQGHRHD